MTERAQAGAALLVAMLTVSLVAMFATFTLWQQWRSIEVEAAERTRVQSGWILTGALGWARLVLDEDLASGSVVHLGEPWATPLAEARLSTFLAADPGGTEPGPEVMDAFLSGQVTDLQARLNISNLADSQDPAAFAAADAAFGRLFQALGLPQSELEQLKGNLLVAVAASNIAPAPPEAPLLPQSVQQLTWLGLRPETAAALEPYVLVMQSLVPTKVNLNTAPAEVIAAAAGVDMAQARQLVRARERASLKTVAEARQFLGPESSRALALLDVNSQFFQVRSRLRLDQLVIEDRAVLQRTGLRDVRILRRERAVLGPEAPAAGPPWEAPRPGAGLESTSKAAGG